MTGRYLNIDGSEYELFYDNSFDGKKKVKSLFAKCVKSQTKSTARFPVDPANIERNIRHMTWVKIKD